APLRSDDQDGLRRRVVARVRAQWTVARCRHDGAHARRYVVRNVTVDQRPSGRGSTVSRRTVVAQCALSSLLTIAMTVIGHRSPWARLAIIAAIVGAPGARCLWREWRIRRAERVGEWIVSLDGRDLAILDQPTFHDMFWDWLRVTPLHPSFVAPLMDPDAW